MSKKVAFEIKVKFNNVEMFDDISAEHFLPICDCSWSRR